MDRSRTLADRNVPIHDRPVGSIWPARYGDKSGYLVTLPGGAHWPTLAGTDRGEGWQVTMPDGDPLRMTVHPSINVLGGWHGWIKDGVISDDVSGKRF